MLQEAKGCGMGYAKIGVIHGYPLHHSNIPLLLGVVRSIDETAPGRSHEANVRTERERVV